MTCLLQNLGIFYNISFLYRLCRELITYVTGLKFFPRYFGFLVGLLSLSCLCIDKMMNYVFSTRSAKLSDEDLVFYFLYFCDNPSTVESGTTVIILVESDIENS